MTELPKKTKQRFLSGRIGRPLVTAFFAGRMRTLIKPKGTPLDDWWDLIHTWREEEIRKLPPRPPRFHQLELFDE